jgi:hypothetical protein
MTTENFCFYLQNRLIQTSQTVGQWYSDTSPFSIPWTNTQAYNCTESITAVKSFTAQIQCLYNIIYHLSFDTVVV